MHTGSFGSWQVDVSAGFFVRRFMGIGGKFWKNRKVRCRDEAEVLELGTE